MIKDAVFKVGDYIIQDLAVTYGIKYNTVSYKDWSKKLKIFEVMSPADLAGYISCDHGEKTYRLETYRYRLANEKEIKLYKLKNMFELR